MATSHCLLRQAIFSLRANASIPITRVGNSNTQGSIVGYRRNSERVEIREGEQVKILSLSDTLNGYELKSSEKTTNKSGMTPVQKKPTTRKRTPKPIVRKYDTKMLDYLRSREGEISLSDMCTTLGMHMDTIRANIDRLMSLVHEERKVIGSTLKRLTKKGVGKRGKQKTQLLHIPKLKAHLKTLFGDWTILQIVADTCIPETTVRRYITPLVAEINSDRVPGSEQPITIVKGQEGAPPTLRQIEGHVTANAAATFFGLDREVFMHRIQSAFTPVERMLQGRKHYLFPIDQLPRIAEELSRPLPLNWRERIKPHASA